MSNLLTEKPVYIESQVENKLIEITAIFANDNEANDYMDEHPEEGVVDSINGLALLANCSDMGIAPTMDLRRTLAYWLDQHGN